MLSLEQIEKMGIKTCGLDIVNEIYIKPISNEEKERIENTLQLIFK